MMIQSLLDNDLYKFTMQWAVMKLYPNTRVQYEFINRGKHFFTEKMVEDINRGIEELCRLRLTKDEYEYIKSIPFLPQVYADFLKGYSFDPSEVMVVNMPDTGLKIEISGHWYRTILWEVPLMAIISEVYCTSQKPEEEFVSASRTLSKSDFFNTNKIVVAELGTRRRFSFKAQESAVYILKNNCESFIGTSNVYLAMKTGLKPIGTQAHEWFMFHGAKYGYRAANKMALRRWTDVYEGDLGIALSDTYTSDVFFKQFSKFHAKLFDGVRHDSGDPVEFARKTNSFYKRMGIDPGTKSIIFSDSLNTNKITRIESYINKWAIKRSYGIGTNLSNDRGVETPNIVIKMVRCTINDWDDWWETVKLSDSTGKYTGEITEVRRCKKELEIGR